MDKQTYSIKDERLDDLQINNTYIYQNPKHYNFTSDAVRLANYAKARTGDTVVDMCSGSGVIGILLSQKTKAKNIILIELQEYLANMSKRSIDYNNLQDKIQVINTSVQNASSHIQNGSVDVVVCNPPYKTVDGSKISDNYEVALCKHELAVTLDDIIISSAKMLKHGGYFYTINKEQRLTDLIVKLKNNKLEPKELVIIPSKKGGSLIMIKAKKGGNNGINIKVVP